MRVSARRLLTLGSRPHLLSERVDLYSPARATGPLQHRELNFSHSGVRAISAEKLAPVLEKMAPRATNALTHGALSNIGG